MLPVGHHDIGRQQIVTGQAVAPAEPAEAAAERQPGDAGRRDRSTGRGEPEGLTLAVEFKVGQPGLGSDGPGDGIDPRTLHPGEINHQTAIAERVPGHTVAAAADRQLEALLPGEVDRRDHVGRTEAARNQGGPPVDHAVEDLAGRVVLGVSRPDQITAEAGAKGFDRGLVHG